MLITADAGGSNGSRLRLWKLEVQKLADETGFESSFPLTKKNADSTFIDYHVARQLGKSDSQRRRRSLLIFSLVLNFGILGVFKYFNFFADSLSDLLAFFGVPHISRGKSNHAP